MQINKSERPQRACRDEQWGLVQTTTVAIARTAGVYALLFSHLSGREGTEARSASRALSVPIVNDSHDTLSRVVHDHCGNASDRARWWSKKKIK
jgi:hypothetical protein